MAFRYKVVKKTIGTSPYTTRADWGTPLTKDEFVRTIVDETSAAEGNVVSILSFARRVLLNAARNGRPSKNIFTLLNT